MEFQVINRSRNAVIPEGMFKLCGRIARRDSLR